VSNFKDVCRIGKDAVTRFTQGGKSVTGFSAAFDTGWGENKKTYWLDVSGWGERYEKVAQYLTKGSLVLVEGDIGIREHEGKTYLTLNLSEIKLIGGKQEVQGGGSGGSRGGAPQRERPQRATDNPVEDFDSDSIPFILQRGNW
jgi:single-strand DNA-binding protein